MIADIVAQVEGVFDDDSAHDIWRNSPLGGFVLLSYPLCYTFFSHLHVCIRLKTEFW